VKKDAAAYRNTREGDRGAGARACLAVTNQKSTND